MASWLSKLVGMDMSLDNLENVLILQLRDLASAEEQLLDALPQVADAASDPDLKNCLQAHVIETRRQRERLADCFRILGHEMDSERCEAMAGLIDEAQELISLNGDPEVKDAALIAAAQRVEHYEIAGYGCARTFARRLGHMDVASLLQESLEEEANADKALTQIAESRVNQTAARH